MIRKAFPCRFGQLQKTILQIALHNRENEGRTGHEDSGADILHTEAIVEHLDYWPGSVRDEQGRRVYSTTIFGISEVGKSTYISAKASVRAAMRSLTMRGLIAPVRGLTGWAGANLTKEGVQVARSLRMRRANGDRLHSDRPAVA